MPKDPEGTLDSAYTIGNDAGGHKHHWKQCCGIQMPSMMWVWGNSDSNSRNDARARKGHGATAMAVGTAQATRRDVKRVNGVLDTPVDMMVKEGNGEGQQEQQQQQ